MLRTSSSFTLTPGGIGNFVRLFGFTLFALITVVVAVVVDCCNLTFLNSNIRLIFMRV